MAKATRHTLQMIDGVLPGFSVTKTSGQQRHGDGGGGSKSCNHKTLKDIGSVPFLRFEAIMREEVSASLSDGREKMSSTALSPMMAFLEKQ